MKTFLASNDDLYEITFDIGGNVLSVTKFPDNDLDRGRNIYYWNLEPSFREKIDARIERLLA